MVGFFCLETSSTGKTRVGINGNFFVMTYDIYLEFIRMVLKAVVCF